MLKRDVYLALILYLSFSDRRTTLECYLALVYERMNKLFTMCHPQVSRIYYLIFEENMRKFVLSDRSRLGKGKVNYWYSQN